MQNLANAAYFSSWAANHGRSRLSRRLDRLESRSAGKNARPTSGRQCILHKSRKQTKRHWVCNLRAGCYSISFGTSLSPGRMGEHLWQAAAGFFS
jgi:hypothetical protein